MNINPANYIGQTIHYAGHHYRITDGPDYRYAAIAQTVNERGQAAMLFLKLDDNGDITRAATRHGSWEDVTITKP